MEGDHMQWVLEPSLCGSAEAGDGTENAHGLGMKRGEAAGHAGPAGHPCDANPLICSRVAGDEQADENSEVLDVSFEIPLKSRSEGPGALGEGHHGARGAELLHRTQLGLPFG